MVFSSIFFVFVFLPLALAVTYAVPRRFRHAALFALNVVFYAWGEPFYVLLLLFSTVVDYTCGRMIDRHRGDHKRMKRYLIVSLLVNLGLLGFFKYYHFFATQINRLLPLLPIVQLPLPLGISFYTFQTMSYTIDVYRGDVGVQKRFTAFASYVSLFPQLIAGPIVRYRDVEDQLTDLHTDVFLFAVGVQRFVVGLLKKLVLANAFGFLFEEIRGLTVVSAGCAWIGIVGYALQIYFDFSGYSDMAIGLGKMLGFTFPENFRYPYLAQSISDFWRRWHITLSTWFKEYVYIPLGGNRKGKQIWLRNLLIVWLLTGLWHGAAWNYIGWGLYYGILLIGEKMIWKQALDTWPRWFKHVYTLVLVLIGWVLFAFEDPTLLIQYAQSLIGLAGPLWDQAASYYVYTYGLLFVIGAIACTPLGAQLMQRLKGTKGYEPLIIGSLMLALMVVTAYLVNAGFNPFLYFRF